jgi:hypothetical protein
MTITVNEKTRGLFPARVRRQAGFRLGDQLLEGRVYGPFHTAAEMIASMKAESKKKVAAK